jgi:membrane-associated protease RseP (regulator of RpoE activity)
MNTKFIRETFIQKTTGTKNRSVLAGLGGAALAALFLAVFPTYGLSRAAASTTQIAKIQAQQSGSPEASTLPAPQFDFGGWLGVGIEEVTPDKAKELKLAAARGVLVTQVSENSPAAKAGLKNGDVITEYNGQRIEGAVQFRRTVREMPAGHTAQLSIWRDARSQTISVEVGSFPEELRNEFRNRFGNNFGNGGAFPRLGPRGPQGPGAQPPSRGGNFDFRVGNTPMLGVSAQDLSGQLGQYFGAPDGDGVLITEVRKDSAAEKAGLRAGDVITKLNGERVRNRAELRDHLREALADKAGAKSVTLGVIRKGTETAISIQPEMPQSPQSLQPRNGRGPRNGGPGDSNAPVGPGGRIPL